MSPVVYWMLFFALGCGPKPGVLPNVDAPKPEQRVQVVMGPEIGQPDNQMPESVYRNDDRPGEGEPKSAAPEAQVPAEGQQGSVKVTVEVESYGQVRRGQKTPHLAGPVLKVGAVDFNAANHYEAQRAQAGDQSTVFVFFATTCKPCLAGIKKLASAASRLKSAGVTVILINSMETSDVIAPWLKSHGVPSDFTVMLDEFGGDCDRFGCKQGTQLILPLSVVVDEHGMTKAIFRQEGPDFVERILAVIQKK